MNLSTFGLLGLVLVVANLGLTAAILWLRYQSNRKLFDTSVKPAPVATKTPFFRHFNGLFDLLDRIPLLRRSGTANEMDLLKAMLICSAPYLIFQLISHQPGLEISLVAIGIFQTVLNALLLAHPATTRLISRKK